MARSSLLPGSWKQRGAWTSLIGARRVITPGGNSYIDRFHCSLKEEEVWSAEYRRVDEAQTPIARRIEEDNHDGPHRGVNNSTPARACLVFAAVSRNEALAV